MKTITEFLQTKHIQTEGLLDVIPILVNDKQTRYYVKIQSFDEFFELKQALHIKNMFSSETAIIINLSENNNPVYIRPNNESKYNYVYHTSVINSNKFKIKKTVGKVRAEDVTYDYWKQNKWCI